MKKANITLNLFKLIVPMLIVFAVGALGFAAKAWAAYGDPPVYHGYFTAGHPFLGSNGYQNVIGPGITNTTNKTTFENNIIGVHNGADTQSGGGFPTQGYALGADFIIQTMRGGSPTDKSRPSASDIADWKQKLSNPDIKIVSGNYCNSSDGNSNNSGYQNGDIAWVNYSQCGITMSFYSSSRGTVYYRIRVDCGNPIGKTNGLPIYNPGWTLTGTTTVVPAGTTTIFPGGPGVTFNNSIHNAGPSNATFGWAVRYCYDACVGAPLTGNFVNATATLAAGASKLEDSWPYSEPGGSTHTKICVWIDYAYATGPGTPSGRSAGVCVNIGAIPPATCSISGLAPTETAGQSIPITITVNYSQAAAAQAVYNTGGRDFWTISAPGVGPTPPGDGGAPVGTTVTWNTTIPGQTAGGYTITYGVHNAISGNITCTTTFTVGNNPFFSVLGGDIAAGPGVCGSSTAVTLGTAEIIGRNTNNNPANTYGGAGSQLGAFAMSYIKSFATGQASATNSSFGNPFDTGANAPWNLAFGNNSATTGTIMGPNNSYGGAFYTPTYASTHAAPGVNNYWCVPDYYNAAKPTGSFTLPGLGPVLKTGEYTDPQNTVGLPFPLPVATITLQPKSYLTLQVSGNLYIRSNINYSYGNVDEIPRLTILVTGDIYIDPGVSHLSGFYVAAGTVYTCANSGGAITTYDGCRGTDLTIDGAISAAKKIVPGRTHGNINDSPADPSDVFQFSPELWLAGIHDPTSLGGSTSAGTWQSITSLPPIL